MNNDSSSSSPLRGKPAALLRRIRSSGGDNDDDDDVVTTTNNTGNNNNDRNTNNDDNNNPPPPAAAAASATTTNKNNNNKNNNEETDDDDNDEEDTTTTLKRLLHRLKREHISNFGKHCNDHNSRPNKQRARYLLEASAGNVGLAAALYWEDYLAVAERNNNNGGGGGEDNTNEQEEEEEEGEGENEVKNSSARKRQREDHHSTSSSATTAGAVAAASSSAKKPATRRKSSSSGQNNNNDDDDDEHTNNNNNHHHHHHLNQSRSELTTMRQFQQELGEKLSSLQERLSCLSADRNNHRQEHQQHQHQQQQQQQQIRRLMNATNNNSNGADMNVDEMLAAVAAASSSAAAAVAARGGGGGGSSSATGRRSGNSMDSMAMMPRRSGVGGGGGGPAPLPPFANMNVALPQPPAGAAAAAALYPDIMRLGLSEGELNGNFAAAAAALDVAAADAGLAAAAAAAASRAEWMGAGAMFGSTRGGSSSSAAGEAFNAALAAALQGEQYLPRYFMPQQQQHQQQAAGAGAGGGEADPAGGVWDQIVSRALANPGRQLESDEARAFLAALAADSAHVGSGMNNPPPAAAAAAAGGNGGNPDDDGDNDDDDDDNDSRGGGGGGGGDGGGVPREERDHDEHHGRGNNADDNNAEAPLRRSLRLRSARRRDAARAAAMEIANQRANRRNNNNINNNNNNNNPAPAAGEDHNVSGSDDETFMPGPVPVFRKGATSSATKSDSTPSKRKKLDDLVSPKLRLHGHSDDESDNAYDDDSVDIDDYLYGSEDYPDPSRVLWDSFPLHNIDGENILDDDAPRVIPISWLRSGFKLSECGNGLAMNEPSEDEWDNIRRSLPQNIRDGPLKVVKALFPYNCKGVSAMLSLVTALLYSGVSLQKGTVSIDMDRVPFDELSLEERRMQFDERLEDVLSSLISVAANAGAQRCKNKLAEYDKFLTRRTMDPEEQSFYLQRRQQLEKRTHLCNVCWWDVDSTTDTTSFPAGKDPMDVHVNNSFTNINDIRSYVRTHLRSFKEPGGCALLLETIIRCHGVEYTEHNFGGEGELLSCNCKESLKHVGSSNVCTKVFTNDCMTPKLLSLLLTGEARASHQNWSGDTFGIGVLRINNDEPPNNQLLRPLKQIWLCQGDTGYSTMFLQKKNLIGREDSLDQPGKGFHLAHWNCWCGELSTMKVISSMFEAEQVSSTVSDDSEEEGRTVMDSICAKIRSEHKRNLVSPWADIAISNAASQGEHIPITDDELKSLKFHPDDEKYYPDQFRRWRFHFGATGPGSAIPADAWIPFYRLRDRQRLVVEMKLAPRIVALVRSRWPMATVRDFSPSGQYPIV